MTAWIATPSSALRMPSWAPPFRVQWWRAQTADFAELSYLGQLMCDETSSPSASSALPADGTSSTGVDCLVRLVPLEPPNAPATATQEAAALPQTRNLGVTATSPMPLPSPTRDEIAAFAEAVEAYRSLSVNAITMGFLQ